MIKKIRRWLHDGCLEELEKYPKKRLGRFDRWFHYDCRRTCEILERKLDGTILELEETKKKLLTLQRYNEQLLRTHGEPSAVMVTSTLNPVNNLKTEEVKWTST